MSKTKKKGPGLLAARATAISNQTPAPDDPATHNALWLKHMQDHQQQAARLPSKSEDRKKIPLASVLDYFPDALCAVAEVVNVGQVQHSTDRWDRSKSTDHEDCLLRHLLDRGTVDTDGMRHSAKVAWRALALLQLEIEKDKGLPPSRGSK